MGLLSTSAMTYFDRVWDLTSVLSLRKIGLRDRAGQYYQVADNSGVSAAYLAYLRLIKYSATVASADTQIPSTEKGISLSIIEILGGVKCDCNAGCFGASERVRAG